MLEEPGSQNQESHTGDVTTEHAPGAEVHLKPGRVPGQPLRAFDFGHFALILSQTLRDTRPDGLCFVAFMIWEEETWREGSSIDCPYLPWAPHLSLPGRMLLGSLGFSGIGWQEAPHKVTHACPVAADCHEALSPIYFPLPILGPSSKRHCVTDVTLHVSSNC